MSRVAVPVDNISAVTDSLPSPLPYAEPAPAWLTALRWLGAIIGTVTLVGCAIVAGVTIAELPLAETDAEEALGVIAISSGVGLAFGVVLLWFSARAYAKVVYSVLALALITGGLAMLVAAPVIRQMNVPHLVEYRGFWAMTWFGVLTTALGLALAALCVRWSLRGDARRRLARWSRIAGSAYGVMLGVTGVLLTLVIFTAFDNPDSFDADGNAINAVEEALAITSLAAWFLVPGVILTYHGISASMGEGSGEFRVPPAAFAVLAFGGVLLLGYVNMTSDSPAAWPMPLLHVLAAALPGIALATMAVRGTPLFGGSPVRGLSWRDVTLAAAISMAVATWIALYVESIGSAYAVVLLLVHNGAFEFAQNSDAVFDQMGDADVILTSNEQFVAGLVAAAVLAPLSEEFAKSLGVRFMMRATTTRAQCFALGAFAGAGFGFLESMLYGLAVISEDLGDWWMIMLVRGGSTSLHVLCSAIAGVAWWYWSRAKRHGVAAALFATSVAIHAFWNGVFTAIDSRILVLDTLEDRTIEIIAYAIVIAVSVAMIAAIPIVARRLREPTPPAIEGTPLEDMRAWLG